MIKSLRKRFIFAAMASTFGVLFVIMSILNVANYVRMVSRADDTWMNLRTTMDSLTAEIL